MVYFDEKDIALIEHEVIKSMALLEGDAKDEIWYLTGVHDLAEAIILKIKGGDN